MPVSVSMNAHTKTQFKKSQNKKTNQRKRKEKRFIKLALSLIFFTALWA